MSSSEHTGAPVSWCELLQAKYCWGAAIGVLLFAFQQFAGINAVVFFSTKVFADAGVSSAVAASWGSEAVLQGPASARAADAWYWGVVFLPAIVSSIRMMNPMDIGSNLERALACRERADEREVKGDYALARYYGLKALCLLLSLTDHESTPSAAPPPIIPAPQISV